MLRAALEKFSESPDLNHALGLAVVRLGRADEALEYFARSADLFPAEPRYAYVYGIALYDTGQKERAFEVLEQAHDRVPANPQVLSALVTYYNQEGNLKEALKYGRKLLELAPTDPNLRQMVESLEAGLSG